MNDMQRLYLLEEEEPEEELEEELEEEDEGAESAAPCASIWSATAARSGLSVRSTDSLQSVGSICALTQACCARPAQRHDWQHRDRELFTQGWCG